MLQHIGRRRWEPIAVTWCIFVGVPTTPVNAWSVYSPTIASRFGWRQSSPSSWSSSQSPVALQAIDGITVDSLSDDHEAVASQLKGSVQRWLDAEWMPQLVHERMAESCQQSYLRCREAGQTEVMTIMIAVAEDLEKNWRDYNADAFVNAWDVGNYVSDYLTAQAGVEGCECSARIY